MSFDVRLRKSLGQFTIDRAFKVGLGLTVLFGRSGSGKTSILNMIAGLLRPDDGRIEVNEVTLFDANQGVNLPPDKRHIGYVFQDARLFPHRRVRSNLLYGYRLARPRERWLEQDQAAAFLGIEHLFDRWPASLSGGEAQRVAIGRALLAAPHGF